MRALTAARTAGVVAASLSSLAVLCDASAHGLDGGQVDPVPGWTFDAWIVVPLLVSALLFAVGWLRLRSRSHRDAARWRRRALGFAAGWGVVAAALVSPLHAAGERSFAAHMVEHELLMLLGAPLLVLAEPLVVLLWALPSAWRRSLGAIVNGRTVAGLWTRATAPLTATALQAAALWLWHAPALFDLALAHDGWHIAQHVSFLGSALLFWTAVIEPKTEPKTEARTQPWTGPPTGARTGPPTRRPARPNAGVAALCLFATSLVSGALGALMALAPSPWYAGYARLATAPFGLTPAEDQQLAGLLMWIPGGLVHAGVALVIVRGLLAAPAVGRRQADAA